MRFLNLDIDGNPSLIENVLEYAYKVGNYQETFPVYGIEFNWKFKAIDPTVGNRLLIDSLVAQECIFRSVADTSFEDVKQAVIQSHIQSWNRLDKELKLNAITHFPSAFGIEEIGSYSLLVFEQLKQSLL